MLVWFDENKKITAWNEIISKQEAKEYLARDCIWVDKNMPIAEEKQGQYAEFYLKDGNIEIQYVRSENPTMSQLDEIQVTINQMKDSVAKREQDVIDEYTLELVEGGVI